MARGYDLLVKAIRSNQLTHSLAQRMQQVIPDRAVTRDLERMGPFRFRLRRHRWMLGNHPFGGEHELTMQCFRRLVRPNDVFYDIGANVGYYVRLIMQELPVSQLVAFEPMQENLDLLRANVTLGRFDDRVTVCAEALSDRDGQEMLQIDDLTGGSAALSSVTSGDASRPRRELGLESKTEQVVVARLDTLVKARSLPLPDVMKIDVEGAEASVIEGARQILLAKKPRMSIALHGPKPAFDTLTLLQSLGATALGEVQGKSGEHRLGPEDAMRLGNNNIIAGWDL